MRAKTKKPDRPHPNSLLRWFKGKRLHRQIAVVIAVSFLLFLTIIVLATQKSTLFARNPLPTLGTVAGDDITVNRDVAYVDQQATAGLREASAKLVPPVFSMNDEITQESVAAFRRFQEIFTDWIQSQDTRENTGGDSPDMLLLQLQRGIPALIGKITGDEVSLLLSAGNVDAVLAETAVLLDEILYRGLLDIQEIKEQDPELFTADSVEIWRSGAGKDQVLIPDIITPARLEDWAEENAVRASLDAVDINLVSLVLKLFAVQNVFYDKEKTELEKKRARDQVQDVMRKLIKGQVLARKGDIIDQNVLDKIKAIGESTVTININSIAGTAFFLGIICALAVFLFNKRFIASELALNQAYLLAGTTLLCLAVGAFLVQISWSIAWLPIAVLIPVSTFTILITLIINTRVGFIYALILSVLIFLITRMDTGSFLFALLSGVAGCAVTLKSERRIDLVRAGLILSAFNAFVLVTLGFLKNFQLSQIPLALGWGVANGFFSGVLSLGFVPILEHLLNASTRFRLMELSDLNAPIFKRMLSLAPGTYNHSIMVANMAESACVEIGANALLARVGAYYHDIGKVDQSRYYIENQREYNRHDDLKPSLSAAVIKSHLKLGIEKAKELGLPREVIDIVSQHHGRGLINYFYQRALKEDTDEKVSSEDYRYSGEWPKTKEAAVVMLADAAEAVSRTFKKPTIARFDKMVWEIIMDRFNAGGLSQSNLTFDDLDKIKDSFVQILAGYFHTRIEYPKQKEAVR